MVYLMKTILSIQSHVAYGYVGNRAAVFPLQLMGFEVIAINTVQFSNHTGYGSFTGQIFEANHIKDVLRGIQMRGLFGQIGAVLSGYLGNSQLGEIVLQCVEDIRAENPSLTYCCDPVMGDTGRGFFVAEDLPTFFSTRAIPDADIITPNQFELSHLASIQINTLKDAKSACKKMHDTGPSIILLTSLETLETKANEIQMLASHKDGRQWVVTTPKIQIEPAPNGAGDMTAAVFLGHILAGESIDHALQNTANSVFSVFEKTALLGRRELALIQAQESFKINQARFKAVAL